MRQLSTGQYLYSPSDLVTFLECSHTSYLSIKSLSEEIQKTEPSSLIQMLQQQGLTHEADYLQSLKEQNKFVVEIPTGRKISENAKLTVEAMRSGADVIYQGALYNSPWQGIADFLIKCKKPSALGNYSYEVLDTKLSKTARAKHVLQLCVYSELVADIQGLQPMNMYLLLGDGEKVCYKLCNFFFYYTHVKKRFEEHIKCIKEIASYPQPCRLCAYCKWQEHCMAQWQEDEHLSLVANIQRKQIEKLRTSGIHSIGELVEAPADAEIPSLSKNTFRRLRTQASLQDYKTKTGIDKYELITPQSNKGFALMPQPDEGDVFFDIEGDPFYPDTLAYLFGLYGISNGKEIFRTFWGHDHEQERENFEDLMDFLDMHLTKYPDAHVYHYGPYETLALKKISHRHAIFEGLLEALLQTQRFIDLYQVVRNAIYISEPNYSLKNLETFYMPQRTDAIMQATDSIVVYNEWRETQNKILLQQIADYNKADCRSTYLLRDWLTSIKPEGVPWREKPSKEISRASWEIEYENYQDWLGVREKEAPLLYQRLAHLLEFHNRETKPRQWVIGNQQNSFEYELADDPDCLVELQQIDEPQTIKNALIYSYKFPPQECALKSGHKVVDIETMEPIGKIDALDETQGVVKIKTIKNTKPLPTELSVGISSSIDSSIIRSAIYRYANHLINTPQAAHVATELLTSNPPRIKGKKPGEAIIDANSDDLLDETLQAIAALDHSCLFIQGPPGSGKTCICSQLIVNLIKRGKKIGISSNSHHAIDNLLRKIEEAAMQKNIRFSGIKKASISNDNSFFDGDFIENKTRLKEIDLNADLFAGTAWTFSSPYFDKQLDYLFIDEAGQVAAANVIAMSNASKNIILVGDHMQLRQPMRGIHPKEAGLSILELLLSEHSTIPSHRGIFLNQTYRLKASICRFISDTFYEGRLRPHESTRTRHLNLQGIDLPNEGIAIINADHENSSRQCSEEGEIINKLYQRLLGQDFTDADNAARSITENDILVVSPYNAQVDYLCTLLPDNARVGTVDKFQGQEAPIVLISMTSSSADYLSNRVVEFLYSNNRLNVALSRAQCLAVVIASPKLMEISCTTIEQMKLVNTYCRLHDYVNRCLHQ